MFAKDFIAELAAISNDANKMSQTITKGIAIINLLLGDENAPKAIEANVVEKAKSKKERFIGLKSKCHQTISLSCICLLKNSVKSSVSVMKI